MYSNIKLTTKQAEEKMKIYREVFDRAASSATIVAF